mmetsp:Transcript_2141/g.9490  ORF Transcript_2141/g.9490 Transcript_2141/m.9490 type:complete len:288 (+) Transcript_2141:616-1479(+)
MGRSHRGEQRGTVRLGRRQLRRRFAVRQGPATHPRGARARRRVDAGHVQGSRGFARATRRIHRAHPRANREAPPVRPWLGTPVPVPNPRRQTRGDGDHRVHPQRVGFGTGGGVRGARAFHSGRARYTAVGRLGPVRSRRVRPSSRAQIRWVQNPARGQLHRVRGPRAGAAGASRPVPARALRDEGELPPAVDKGRDARHGEFLLHRALPGAAGARDDCADGGRGGEGVRRRVAVAGGGAPGGEQTGGERGGRRRDVRGGRGESGEVLLLVVAHRRRAVARFEAPAAG